MQKSPEDKEVGTRKSKILLPAYIQLHCATESSTREVGRHSGLLSLPKSQMFLAMGKLSFAPWHLVSVTASRRTGQAHCVEGQVALCNGFFK